MKPKSLMIVIYVHDMARAVNFYRDGLGLDLVTQSPGWSMLSCGQSLVGLHHIYKGVTETIVPFAGLNLEVDDLDAAVAHAVSHGATLNEIREPQPRVPVRLAVLTDPDGNGFELRKQYR
jgi:catechol 2,3-dioxygenase-like lactoylglutathione lyase family enzyme